MATATAIEKYIAKENKRSARLMKQADELKKLNDDLKKVAADGVERKLILIAQMQLDVETLATRGTHGLDFHTVSVWGLRKALELAFEAGREAGK